MSAWTLDDLAQLIDHTNLHADATPDDMRKLCDEARKYHFRSSHRLPFGTDIHCRQGV